jgi:hypothetical protein
MPDSFEQQRALANYCRTGDLPEGLLVKPDQVHHYRRLVFQIVEDALQSAYPIARQWLEQHREWDGLVQRYWHHCRAPHHQVWKLPQGLISHVAEHESHLLTQMPYLPDLLQFEWDDLELFMRQQSNTTPVHTLRRFHYPVHRIPPKELAQTQPNQWFVLGIRHPRSHLVHFFELQPLHAALAELQGQGLGFTESSQHISQHFQLDLAIVEHANEELQSQLTDFNWLQ